MVLEISGKIKKICRSFELGEVLRQPEPVCGGRLHHVWKLETTEGSFALKVLNERLMQKKDIASAYERSENLARSFAALKIPAVSALLRNSKSLHIIEDSAYMIFPWIEGKALKVGTVDDKCAEKMGTVLGHIHAINLGLDPEHKDFKKPAFSSGDPDKWSAIISETKAANIPLGDVLAENTEKIRAWSLQACNAVEVLNKNLILSHGDLDQHNVIWRDNFDPAIIDWESAGLQNPFVELLNLCLDWSGFPESSPNKQAFLACLQGYQKANAGKTLFGISATAFSESGFLESGFLETVFNGEIAYLLRWLLFSLHRALASSNEEKQIALSEAQNAWRSLCLFEECKPFLIECFRI